MAPVCRPNERELHASAGCYAVGIWHVAAGQAPTSQGDSHDLTARTYTAVLALASAGAFALPAVAEEMKFMAELTGAAQVPPVETEATGVADVTVDTEAMTISWMVTYEGLSGDPVAGHFHGPATPEETAPPVIDLTVDMEEAAEEAVPQDIMEGSSELTEEQLADLQAGLFYINIHTEQNPDGEIRGQVVEGEAEMDACRHGGRGPRWVVRRSALRWLAPRCKAACSIAGPMRSSTPLMALSRGTATPELGPSRATRCASITARMRPHAGRHELPATGSHGCSTVPLSATGPSYQAIRTAFDPASGHYN